MWGKCIDLPHHSAPSAGPPTMANEQSISLRCLWVWQKSFLALVPARAAATSATVTIAVESFRTIFQTRSVEEDPASVAVRAQIRN